jgi:hypothetical protein
MAIVWQGVRCAICNEEIEDINRYIDYAATSGVFFPRDDPLVSYCDAPLHWTCFENWPHRTRFARQNFEMWVRGGKSNPYWTTLALTSGYILAAGLEIPYIVLRLAETPTEIRLEFSGWDRWISDESIAIKGLHLVEVRALTPLLPEIRHTFPSLEAIHIALQDKS